MIRNEHRWERAYAHVVRSDGPARVIVDDPAPDGWKPPRLIGFAPAPVEREPLLWDGDQA